MIDAPGADWSREPSQISGGEELLLDPTLVHRQLLQGVRFVYPLVDPLGDP